MPFDPRVIGDDDEFVPDEFGGDEQLEALGAQLREDAAHLANVYPPKPMAMVKEIEPPRSLHPLRLLWLSGIAAASVAAFLFIPMTFRALSTPNAPSVFTALPSEAEVTIPVSPTAPVPTETMPAVTPVVHQNLTGPEWEAVLDLLEYEAEPGQSISL